MGSPTDVMKTPTRAVLQVRQTRVVEMTSWSGMPSSSAISAISEAIAERKMRPTSCTWPTAKTRLLQRLKTTIWMAELRKISLVSWGRCRANAAACITNNSAIPHTFEAACKSFVQNGLAQQLRTEGETGCGSPRFQHAQNDRLVCTVVKVVQHRHNSMHQMTGFSSCRADASQQL